MEFGIQFFPNVTPEKMSAEQWFENALRIAELSEGLGYTHVRIVEHYFERYGGYSPNPLIFLSAVAARTRTTKVVTGAVLPVFNHPLKLAGEIGMVDAISHGRVEIGFARAFLPHEFGRFGVSLDESRERFDEGVAQITRLLEEQDVAADGKFHRFPATTSLPRPTQRPRPPFWVAAIATEESFRNAARLGHGVMAIPVGADMRKLIKLYRDEWRAAGHPGNGRVMIAFHMFCHEDHDEAHRIAREPLEWYLKGLVDAASDWDTASTKAYPGYDKMIAKLREDTFESQIAQGSALIGTPAEVAEQLQTFIDRVGDIDVGSLQVNFSDLPFEPAYRSMELFAREVLPRFRGTTAAATAR